MNKTRYCIAVFFILCGLIIGIVGGYGCVAVKHYEGVIPVDSPQTKELIAKYSEYIVAPDTGEHLNYIIVSKGDLAYAFQDTPRIIDGLPYTNYSNLLWLAMVAGLVYVGLGVWGMIDKQLFFKK